MANVIDRLRVQGNPAPRNLPSHPDPGTWGLGGRRRRRRGSVGDEGDEGDEGDLPPDQQTVQFLLNRSHLQNRDTNSG